MTSARRFPLPTDVSALKIPPRFRFLMPTVLVLALVSLGTLLFAQTGANSGDPGLPGATVAHPDAVSFDPVSLAWQLGAVVLLIFINAFFAIAEYSLITVRATRIDQLVEENNRSAVLVQR